MYLFLRRYPITVHIFFMVDLSYLSAKSYRMLTRVRHDKQVDSSWVSPAVYQASYLSFVYRTHHSALSQPSHTARIRKKLEQVRFTSRFCVKSIFLVGAFPSVCFR